MAVSNYKELRIHLGHKIVCVGYALQDKQGGKSVSEFSNVAVECESCNEVLFDFDREGGE